MGSLILQIRASPGLAGSFLTFYETIILDLTEYSNLFLIPQSSIWLDIAIIMKIVSQKKSSFLDIDIELCYNYIVDLPDNRCFGICELIALFKK